MQPAPPSSTIPSVSTLVRPHSSPSRHRLRLHRHHRQGRRQPVPAGSILSIMGLGIKQGDSVVIDVQGADDETVADNLLNILSTPSDLLF